MLLKANALMKSKVLANDGEVGSLVDVYFDDTRWVARYLVIETGRWQDRKHVLVSPASLHRKQGEFGVVHADLDSEQIRNSPAAEADRPLSRRFEDAHARHFGYPGYWNGSSLWGAGAYPGVIAPMSVPGEPLMSPAERDEAQAAFDDAEHTHLRSAKELIGYRVEGSDGVAGEIDDFAVDDQDWSIRYLIVDAKLWWPGGQVMVTPDSVESIRYEDNTVKVRQTKDELSASPAV
jgi:hypothetical protein